MTIRFAIDILTGSGGQVDGWFWAFILSLIWSLGSLVRHYFASRSVTLDEIATPTRPLSRASSQRSCATTHTVSDSAASCASRDSKEGDCESHGILLRKKGNYSLESTPCTKRNAAWHRLSPIDGRLSTCGKTNKFDGQEWVKLCTYHTEQYEDGSYLRHV